MEVQKDSVGTVNVARLSGELDASNAEEFHNQITPMLLDQRPVVIDFTRVSCMSDAGLRTLMAVYRQAQAVEARVAVVGLSSELRDALDATGYIRYLRVADDVAGGLRALNAGQPAGSVMS